jgi:trk system potassium uptake protein TrkH
MGMMAGGTNFLVHDRLIHGHWSALWDNREIRLWWSFIGTATFLVLFDQKVAAVSLSSMETAFRRSLFQVVSIITTTGYATADIGGIYFGGLSRQVFLLLMVVGGCVGSTGGGLKVLRFGILWEVFAQQIRSLTMPHRASRPVVIDGEIIKDEEIRRVAALFFMWLTLLALGALITDALSDLGALEGASGMFSALGNIGPCYIDTPTMQALPWGVKCTYILGMLAGRLEIFPLLMLFTPSSWR